MSTTAAPDVTTSADGQNFGTRPYRGYALTVLTLVYTLNFIDRNLLGVVGQPVMEAFNLNDVQYGFLNGPPFAFFYALMGIPIAMAADRYNRVALIAVCIAIWSLMAALCGLASSFLFLLFARIGVAIGEAGCTPPAVSIVSDYFKPKNRANALGIYAMGVTLGGVLASGFGGPIAGLHGSDMENFFNSVGMEWAANALHWSEIEGWRLAFVLIGAPGLIVSLIVLFTIKEPPRGYSDPPGAQRVEKASFTETMKELSTKKTFWLLAGATSTASLVGYGLYGFQAPLVQRIHGVGPAEFAINFGVPLAIAAAVGTFLGGFLTEKLTPKLNSAVAVIPVIGLLGAIPLYIYAWYLPTEKLDTALITWCVGAALHYAYIGSQYTIGQGVVSQRSRATAIAVLLFIIAIIGNGLGPLIVGWLSDTFMAMEIAANDTTGQLSSAVCRANDLSHLTLVQQAACQAAYGDGLRLSMAATAMLFVVSAAFFAVSAFTLKKDLVARMY